MSGIEEKKSVADAVVAAEETTKEGGNGSPFFAFLRRLRYIRRWSLMRNSEDENNAEHSLEVAFIAHQLGILHNLWLNETGALAEEGTSTEINTPLGTQAVTTAEPVDANRLAVLAMYHDVAEIFTGDMPTPIKYFDPKLRALYGEVEQLAQYKLWQTLPETVRPYYEAELLGTKNATEARLLKAADTLAAFMKCIAERQAGNDEFNDAYTSIEAKVEAYEDEAVKRFVALYLPALERSLDQLNYGIF